MVASVTHTCNFEHLSNSNCVFSVTAPCDVLCYESAGGSISLVSSHFDVLLE